MTAKRPLSAALILGVAVATAVSADQGQRGGSPWQWTLQAGTVYQTESSLDSGGDMSVDRLFVSAGGSRVFGDGWRIGGSLGYGEDHYDFSGASGFGGPDPWGRIREVRISMPVQYLGDEHWTFYAIPSLRFNAESGASLSDGRNGGVIAGAVYRVSDRLSIGPGLGAFTEIEEDASFFPILLVDWKITDTVSLETGGGFAASRGPGLQLRWRYSPRWQFAFGGRYEKTRFRLDDSGPAPDGVGQDKAVPLFALAEFSATPDVKLSLIGGAEVGAELRLEDRSGDLVSRSDLSTAAFFGATFQAKF